MITINIYEKNNHLYADDQTKPIVCGNTNYQIEFDFQGDFADVTYKVAVLVIGDKKMAIDFEGTTLDLPALPNGNELKLVVMSAEEDDLELVSSVLTLALKPTLDADNLKDFKPISNYVSQALSKIKGLLDGSLMVKSAETATTAQSATTASSATIAENVSNPNLLINGDFKVNQRGKTTYSTANAYTVDRWKLVSGSLTVESSGITLNGTITQTLENPPTMDVVASVDTSNGDVTATYASGVFTITTTNETLITWAKLEVGTTATTFSPRPYAEELSLCQRYYIRFLSSFYTTGVSVSSTQVRAFYTLPTALRSAPTITADSITSGNIVYEGNIIPNSSFAFYIMQQNQITVTITASSTISSQRIVNISTGGDISFDAEIY